MRKQIAGIHSEHGWHIGYESADKAIALICTETRKLKNPYPEKRGFMAQYTAYEEARQEFISLLTGETK